MAAVIAGGDTPNLITDVQTTAAGLCDVEMTAPVQDALAERGLPPETHLVDAGYVDAALLVSSRADHAIDLLGPVLPDSSWRARNGRDSISVPSGSRGTSKSPAARSARPAGCGRRGMMRRERPWCVSASR